MVGSSYGCGGRGQRELCLGKGRGNLLVEQGSWVRRGGCGLRTLLVLPGQEPRVTELQEQEKKAHTALPPYCPSVTQNKLDPSTLSLATCISPG